MQRLSTLFRAVHGVGQVKSLFPCTRTRRRIDHLSSFTASEVPMECNRKLPCVEINETCRKDSIPCPSVSSGVSCWSTSDVSCCRRNDKSRCVYCFVYLNFLLWTETGELRRTKPCSFGEKGFRLSSLTTSQPIRPDPCDHRGAYEGRIAST
jgi:hypothetical protein